MQNITVQERQRAACCFDRDQRFPRLLAYLLEKPGYVQHLQFTWVPHRVKSNKTCHPLGECGNGPYGMPMAASAVPQNIEQTRLHCLGIPNQRLVCAIGHDWAPC